MQWQRDLGPINGSRVTRTGCDGAIAAATYLYAASSALGTRPRRGCRGTGTTGRPPGSPAAAAIVRPSIRRSCRCDGDDFAGQKPVDPGLAGQARVSGSQPRETRRWRSVEIVPDLAGSEFVLPMRFDALDRLIGHRRVDGSAEPALLTASAAVAPADAWRHLPSDHIAAGARIGAGRRGDPKPVATLVSRGRPAPTGSSTAARRVVSPWPRVDRERAPAATAGLGRETPSGW